MQTGILAPLDDGPVVVSHLVTPRRVFLVRVHQHAVAVAIAVSAVADEDDVRFLELLERMELELRLDELDAIR